LADVKISPVGIVIGLGAVLVAGAFAWLTFAPKPAPPPAPVLTAEARAYLPSLKLSNVHMQAAESYVNQRLVEILGEITNAGDRRVKVIEVTCVFKDFSLNEIDRERTFVVGAGAAALGPGQTRPFRLAFDTIPETWNQVMPSLIIAQIQFE